MFLKLLLRKVHKIGENFVHVNSTLPKRTASGPLRCKSHILIARAHVNCSISSSEFGFPCRFHDREESTEQHSGCYISLLWICMTFFCFWETDLCLGYSQNPISEPLELKPHFWIRMLSSEASRPLPSDDHLWTHPFNLHNSSGSSVFYCCYFVCSVCVHIYPVSRLLFSASLSLMLGGGDSLKQYLWVS